MPKLWIECEGPSQTKELRLSTRLSKRLQFKLKGEANMIPPEMRCS